MAKIVKWVLKDLERKKYLTGSDLKNGLKWGTFNQALHCNHPLQCWQFAELFNLDPERYEVVKIMKKIEVPSG